MKFLKKTSLSMLILMVALSLSNSTTRAQPANYHWANRAGGTNHDFGNGIVTDGSGNSIVTGRFAGTASFGDSTFTSAGGSDIFIAKYDGDGKFLWVEQAGGTNDDVGFGIATDGLGNSKVTGGFKGTATFGDTTLTSPDSQDDIFIAKYDSDGNFRWVEQAGGTGSDEGRAIAMDGSGNSIVTGRFEGTASFGDSTFTSAGSSDIFIAKYDGDGKFLWVEQAGATGIDQGYSIAKDGSGNSIVTGYFEGTATFGDSTFTSAGGSDIFIAKYDGDGKFLWVEQAGATGGAGGRAIATDGSGNSILTGYFCGTATFGDTTLMANCYVRDLDIFIAKYDADGNFIWVVQAGGNYNKAVGYGIATDGSGNSIVTGYFRKTPTFGDTTLISAGSEDIFIAKLGAGVTGIEEEFALPSSFNLSQNYHNPFNPTTTIEFSLPQSEFVTLKIYNVLGEEVATLVSERLNAGKYKYNWDASSLASGVYLYRIQAGDYVEIKKMILLK